MAQSTHLAKESRKTKQHIKFERTQGRKIYDRKYIHIKRSKPLSRFGQKIVIKNVLKHLGLRLKLALKIIITIY